LEVKEGDITLQALLNLFKERFGLEISMLSYGPSMLYYNFGMVKKEVKERLPLKITQVIEKVAKIKLRPKERYIVLEAVVANEKTGDECEIPYIRLKIRD